MLLKNIMPTQNFYRKSKEFWKTIVKKGGRWGGEGREGRA
jgi:hypothetical protein